MPMDSWWNSACNFSLCIGPGDFSHTVRPGFNTSGVTSYAKKGSTDVSESTLGQLPSCGLGFGRCGCRYCFGAGQSLRRRNCEQKHRGSRRVAGMASGSNDFMVGQTGCRGKSAEYSSDTRGRQG